MTTIKKFVNSPHTKRLTYSVIDQIILSSVNFFLSYFLMKILTKEEYGLYNLIIPISLIFTAVQNALFNTPLMVEYWNKNETEKNFFVGSLLLIQKKILVLSLLLFLTLIVTFIFIDTGESTNFILFATYILILGLLSREFLRNYFFTIEKPLKAVINDFNYLILIFLFFIVIYYLNLINIESILICIGIASLISSIFGNIKLANHNDFAIAKKHFIECFKHGKWALLGVIVTHVQTYGYIYLIGIFFSTKDIGEIAAIRLLFIPFSFITVGYSKIAIPRGSKLFIQGKIKKFFNEELFFSLSYMVVVFLYTIIVNFTPENVLGIILKREYLDALKYIPLFSITTILSILGTTGSNGLQVMKKFKSLSQINTLAMITVLTFTLIAIHFWGVYGALIANICGQLINASGMWYLFTKLKNKELFS